MTGVQGDFRTEFDLHRFPLDRQRIQLRFMNPRAASDRIVYVLDKREPTEAQSRRSAVSASPERASKSSREACSLHRWRR